MKGVAAGLIIGFLIGYAMRVERVSSGLTNPPQPIWTPEMIWV